MLHDIRWSSKRFSKTLELLQSQVYRKKHSLAPFQYYELDSPASLSFDTFDFKSKESEDIEPNSAWSGAEKNFVLRTQFQIPDKWSNENLIGLFLPIGVAGDFSHPEALIYLDGEPYASVDRHHQEVIFPEDILNQVKHELVLHGWTGSLSKGEVTTLWMGEPCLVTIDQETRDLVSISRVALGIAEKLKPDDPVRAKLLTAVERSFILLDFREPIGDGFYNSIPDALKEIKIGIKRSGAPREISIWAAGHAHIDIAWLWTLRQSRQKAGRTFHNVLRLMENYPQFSFSQSQPQLYEFVRQDFPELFEAIKNKIAQGQWEPLGGMWVESDCNIPGGESLVRQLLLGRNYFKQQFGEGAESPVLWLPDVFGFPWSLPQLINDAGLDSFFTIKLGWSQYNRIPYDSFWWQGLDGTRILTHFSTTRGSNDTFISSYNAKATPDEVLTTWENFQQKDIYEPGQSPPLMMVYGYGDGGGGPTREMIENLQVMERFPGTPQVRMGKAGHFFDELRERSGDKLPTWNDELYLEYHRGTYTSQARNKRANRRSEILLHNLEFIASAAVLFDEDFDYPVEDLNRLWQLVCLNQFHDILPGTSIREVYVESQEQYAEIEQLGTSLTDEALAVLASHFPGEILIINSTSFSRSDMVSVPQKFLRGTEFEKKDGYRVEQQITQNGVLLDVGKLPPYSVTSLKKRKSKSNTIPKSTNEHGLIVQENLLENKYLRVEFDEVGDIARIYDNELDKEVIPSGAVANQFQAYEDRPKTPDAWEIDITYDEKMWLADPANSMKIVEQGPLRATIEIEKTILNSTIRQRISLAYNARQLVFSTDVDWMERFVLLKVAFPVQVLSPTATYEIQWGDIQRPTHRNTSWDWAKFEVPAHKWVDLSEGGYGVSLLNDCKYGHSVQNNVIQLTLLRSPSYPDPTADEGQHQFTYSLLPHGGNWKQGTIQAAYELNYPYINFYSPDQSETNITTENTPKSFIQVNPSHVIIETIKQAEDGNGIIIRMFESQRCRGKFEIIPSFDLSHASRVNLLEEEIEELEFEENSIAYDITPYQILSFRLVPNKK